jgi:hypothetical protein
LQLRPAATFDAGAAGMVVNLCPALNSRYQLFTTSFLTRKQSAFQVFDYTGENLYSIAIFPKW